MEFFIELIIQRFLIEHKVLNKTLMKWFIHLGKEYYGINEDYNFFIKKLFYVPGLDENNGINRLRYRRYSVDTPFRYKQKFVKNLSNIKYKEITEYELKKIDYKKYKTKKNDNQKRFKRKWKYWCTKNGNRRMRRATRELIKLGGYDDIPTLDEVANPWDWN